MLRITTACGRLPPSPILLHRKQSNVLCSTSLVASVARPLLIKGQCLSLLTNACSSMDHLHQIHARLQTSGLAQDAFLTSELVRFCSLSPSGCLSYASALLYHSPDPTPASWNHVIRGHAVRGSPRDAVEVFLHMRSRGSRPGSLTFPFLLKACAALDALDLGRQVHAEIVKSAGNGCDDGGVYVRNGLISFYGSCRKVLDAWKVFDGMPTRTVVSWNAILSTLVGNSWLDEAVELFLAMRHHGYEPDETTTLVMLSASVRNGNLRLGMLLHSQMVGKGVPFNIKLGTALVDMYAKCGAIASARAVFHAMPEKNVWMWSAMISGFAQHGLVAEALDLFLQMKKAGSKPNDVTFLGVLSACSHAGLIDDGFRFFNEMTSLYNIEPRMSHYSAMVDVLGRSGRLDEAYRFIGNMPIDPDPVVWRTLLGACNRSLDKSGIGDVVRMKLLQLEPKRCGNYVMAANSCAEFGHWEEVAKFRRRMREEGLRKSAGESCIEVDGMIHRFYSGEDARLGHEDVYTVLVELTANTRKPCSKNAHLP